jgi:hypothetical protein
LDDFGLGIMDMLFAALAAWIILLLVSLCHGIGGKIEDWWAGKL